RGAARPDRLRSLPLDRVEREAEVDARLDAQIHIPRDLRDHDASPRPAATGGPPGGRREHERRGNRDSLERRLAALAGAPGAAILGRSPGPLAQLGERRLDKPEVTGSSPVRPIAGP